MVFPPHFLKGSFTTTGDNVKKVKHFVAKVYDDVKEPTCSAKSILHKIGNCMEYEYVHV